MVAGAKGVVALREAAVVDPLVKAWAATYPPAHANWQTLGPTGQRCIHWSGDANLAFCPKLGVIFYAVDRWDALARPELKLAQAALDAAYPETQIKRVTLRLDSTGRAGGVWAAKVTLADGRHIDLPTLGPLGAP